MSGVSYIRELARLICRGQRKYIAMLHAYCDESYTDSPERTPVYVVAGFVGSVEQWAYFESLWRESMKALKITAIGCHASKCANGAGPYRDLSVERRNDIQHRLIVDIVTSRLYGAVAVIDMDGYRAHKDTLLRYLAKHDRQYFKPHVRAVEQCVYQMCLATSDATAEPIAFLCDRNQAAGGSVGASLAVARRSPHYRFASRIGPYAEDDRLQAIGLQAADMLAYSAFRHANRKVDPNAKECWQWDALRSAIKATEFTTGEAFWGELARVFQEGVPEEFQNE